MITLKEILYVPYFLNYIFPGKYSLLNLEIIALTLLSLPQTLNLRLSIIADI